MGFFVNLPCEIKDTAYLINREKKLCLLLTISLAKLTIKAKADFPMLIFLPEATQTNSHL